MKSIVSALAALFLFAVPALAETYQVVPTCGGATPGPNSQGYMDATGNICIGATGGAAAGSGAPTSGLPVFGLTRSQPLNGTPSNAAGTVQPFTLSPQGSLFVEPYLGGFPVGESGGGNGTSSGVHPIELAGAYHAAIQSASDNHSMALQTDLYGNLLTTMGGVRSTLGITSATEVKAGVGRIHKVTVVVMSGAVQSVGDSATAALTTAQTILSIPASAPVGTVYTLDWPVAAGIAVLPGASGTLAISYD